MSSGCPERCSRWRCPVLRSLLLAESSNPELKLELELELELVFQDRKTCRGIREATSGNIKVYGPDLALDKIEGSWEKLGTIQVEKVQSDSWFSKMRSRLSGLEFSKVAETFGLSHNLKILDKEGEAKFRFAQINFALSSNAWYFSVDGRCEARVQRAWMPPPSLWPIEPRSPSHARGGWYIELARPEVEENAIMHEALNLLQLYRGPSS
mmetsp:Transcript_9469/g.17478  ORF Transcript_9469/g.17478 Transcript_9469/m.17478 type:complete len:210 (+) Transcript_9469:2037-2666(+)